MTALPKRSANPPQLAQGTRIYDAIERALDAPHEAKLSTASVVLLSDGADIGSTSELEQSSPRAQAQRVRIFTVGLSSPRSTRPPPSHRRQTGGAYAEPPRPRSSRRSTTALGNRLAQEYLVQYRSDAKPKSHVDVEISVTGPSVHGDRVRRADAPGAGAVPPVARLALRALTALDRQLVGALLRGAPGCGVRSAARPRAEPDVVERIGHSPARRPERSGDATSPRAPGASGSATRERWWARLEGDLELAGSSGRSRSPRCPADGSVVLDASCSRCFSLALIAPIFVVLGLLTPLARLG